MSDLQQELQQQPKREAKHQRERPPRWLLTLILAGMFAMAYWGITNQLGAVEESNLATLQKQTAQSNALNLAEEIKTRCESEKSVIVAARDLCAKADSVTDNPTAPIQGVAGKDGLDGINGRDGAPGKDGAPGSVGPIGPDGPVGATGATGTAGADGRNGIDGTNGQPGIQGQPGAQGAAGPPPSSIKITDAAGKTQTCTPNPPGSTDYTCTYDKPTGTL